jgi:minor histocompatibility antigen H13
VSIVYVSTGSWLASNLFGLAFSVQGIELLSLGSYLNGCILLCGLFVYDVFWVFGTDVMVTVAKSFDAPIKLLFPQATWWNGEGSENRPSMLGLGDIVIPGIFIALLLRYDIWRHIQSIRAKALKAGKSEFTKDEEHELDCLYCHVRSPAHGSSFRATFFHANLVAYVLGLATTVLVMYAFQAAQPALLYLVPACLGASIALGALRRRGELKTLWSYTENEDDKASALEAEEKLKMAPATAAAAEAKHNDEGADAGVAAKAFSSQVAAEAEAAAAKAAAASSAAPVEDAVAASASASSTDGVAVQRPSVRKSSSAKKKGGSSKKKKSARAE